MSGPTHIPLTRLIKEERSMLVLSRKTGQTIIIGETIKVKIVRVRGGRVQMGIDCPRSIPIDRLELHQKKDALLAREPARI
jgi:carbon storage regulator CsrA